MKNYLSLKVQMVYVAITGLQLVFIPNTMLSMFSIEPTNEIWIRILGVIVAVLAILYFGILKNPNPEVIRYTVYGRLAAAFGIIALAFVFGPKILILFASVDIITAIWTWVELKSI